MWKQVSFEELFTIKETEEEAEDSTQEETEDSTEEEITDNAEEQEE